MISWAPNPNWTAIQTPNKGDIVVLWQTSDCGHYVRVKVSAVDGNSITGVVTEVFASNGAGQITAGTILDLVHMKVNFTRDLIQKCFKMPNNPTTPSSTST
jgi:hypothetical protein